MVVISWLHRGPNFNLSPAAADRITRTGNGLVLTVDVATGSEPFQVLLGRPGESTEWSGMRFTKTGHATDAAGAHGLVIRLLKLCEAAGLLSGAVRRVDCCHTSLLPGGCCA